MNALTLPARSNALTLPPRPGNSWLSLMQLEDGTGCGRGRAVQ